MLRVTPALQNILEKSVRELGAIRLIDSRIGDRGQLACNPRVILGRFRTTIRFASLQLRVLLVNLRLYSIHSDIHRTSGSLGHGFCWTRNTDAAGLAGVASDRHRPALQDILEKSVRELACIRHAASSGVSIQTNDRVSQSEEASYSIPKAFPGKLLTHQFELGFSKRDRTGLELRKFMR